MEREGGIHEQIFGLHRKLSRRFPYAIYYRIDESVIDVVAVLDCRRDPNSLSERLTRRSGWHPGPQGPHSPRAAGMRWDSYGGDWPEYVPVATRIARA